MADTTGDGVSSSENGKAPSNEGTAQPPVITNSVEETTADDLDDKQQETEQGSSSMPMENTRPTNSFTGSPDLKNDTESKTASNHSLPSPAWPCGAAGAEAIGVTPSASTPVICTPTSFSVGPSRNLFSGRSSFCGRSLDMKMPARNKPVLRPSQLANPTPPKCSNPFVLKAPKLVNPFSAKTEDVSSPSTNRVTQEADSSSEKEASSSSSSLGSLQLEANSTTSKDSGFASPSALSASPATAATPSQHSGGCSPGAAAMPAFVPLSTPSGSAQSTPVAGLPPTPTTIGICPTTTNISTPSTSSFVFGQNLHERVLVEPTASEPSASGSSEAPSTVPNNDEGSCSSASAAAQATTNGTSEMLFSSVIQKELPEKPQDSNVDERGRKSLSEAAREYEESRAVKRKYEEVAVVTGEEEENNILQMDCKLFVYDGLKFNYSEGVHGTLRVNDPPNGASKKMMTQSRVIVRMSGSLRVLMNTKIWAGMRIEKPNRKIVRMTAMDSIGQIKIFLISSSPSESDMLYRVLESRIKVQKEVTGAFRNGSAEEHDERGSSGMEEDDEEEDGAVGGEQRQQ